MEAEAASETESETETPRDKRPEPFAAEVLARELNAGQLEAVLAPPGPTVVVAGAGSGKTRVITYRLARLVATGADARRIIAVTFTNKAAGELRERVDKLLWERMRVGSRGLWVGTFHAVSARILRQWGEAVGLRKDFVIYDDDDQKRLLGAGAHRSQGARADVPGAAGAVGDRSGEERRASRRRRSTPTTTSTTWSARPTSCTRSGWRRPTPPTSAAC